MSTAKTLQAIKFNKDTISLEILDQLLLPYSTTYIPISSIEDAFQAIKSMQVRGAPAIAIVGAFAVLVEAHTQLKLQNVKPIGELIQSIEYLITSRPTAVNLSNALNEIGDLLLQSYKTDQLLDQGVVDIIFKYSVALYEDDLENNFKIGDNGLKYIVDTLVKQNFKGPFSIMTICNTGSLATSGHGTALGIIRSTFKSLQKEAGSHDFWLDQVYPCETRPYNQGAKLTTYELKYEEIPFVLICDNMVTSLINTLNVQKKPIKSLTAPVKFIIAGADRVVKNGDSANKIGTYQLATIANQFNTRLSSDESIKFIIAAPNTTIDLNTKSGEDIVIEERPSNELTTIKGPVLTQNTTTNQVDVGDKYTVGIATPDISVWNPAFDVTPHDLIDAIVTEEAAIIKQNGEFKLSK